MEGYHTHIFYIILYYIYSILPLCFSRVTLRHLREFSFIHTSSNEDTVREVGTFVA